MHAPDEEEKERNYRRIKRPNIDLWYSGTQSSSSPKETMPQYGTGLTLAQSVVQGGGMDQNQVGTPQSQDTSPSDLTMEQKDEIASFASINPELSVDMIRENYAEKFKKIITPDMLTKIMKRGRIKISKNRDRDYPSFVTRL